MGVDVLKLCCDWRYHKEPVRESTMFLVRYELKLMYWNFVAIDGIIRNQLDIYTDVQKYSPFHAQHNVSKVSRMWESGFIGRSNFFPFGIQLLAMVCRPESDFVSKVTCSKSAMCGDACAMPLRRIPLRRYLRLFLHEYYIQLVVSSVYTIILFTFGVSWLHPISVFLRSNCASLTDFKEYLQFI
jgi:hypothetical protein